MQRLDRDKSKLLLAIIVALVTVIVYKAKCLVSDDYGTRLASRWPSVWILLGRIDQCLSIGAVMRQSGGAPSSTGQPEASTELRAM